MSLAASWENLAEVRVRVPGKINLALCVGRRRRDGYHELATIFQAVSLYDIVSATSAETVTCAVSGVEAAKIGPPEQNLAVQAARLLQTEYDVHAGVSLRIEKRIPVAGGMGGGSADAAAALLACARLWELPASQDDLMALGARLGADVPFLLMGGSALGLGKGETLTATLARGRFHWVLAFANLELSTPAAYARYDQLAEATGRTIPITPTIPRPLMMALAAGDQTSVGRLLVNDLSAAACSIAPGLRATLTAGREAGCLGAIISGSGPTVAFLTPSETAATELAVHLSSQGIAKEVRLVTGPVPGATII